MTEAFNTIKKAWDAWNTVSDSVGDDKPLVSRRHPVLVGGIEVTGEWLELYDAVCDLFTDYDADLDDYTFDFLDPEYIRIREAFNILFLRYNKK